MNIDGLPSDSELSSLQVITPSEAPSFITRVREHLSATKRSGRWLEIEAGMAVGTFSKIASGKGRTRLDLSKLQRIAKALAVPAVSLVQGTPFAGLLSDEVAVEPNQTLAVIDDTVARLRVEISDKQAKIDKFRDDHFKLKTQIATYMTQRSRAIAQCADVRSRLESANAYVTQIVARCHHLGAERDEIQVRYRRACNDARQQAQIVDENNDDANDLYEQLSQANAANAALRVRIAQLEIWHNEQRQQIEALRGLVAQTIEDAKASLMVGGTVALVVGAVAGHAVASA